MFRFLPSLKRVSTALFVLLAFSLPLLFTACGSSMSSTAPTPAPSPEWMWVSGSNTVGKNSGQPGVYGTLGVIFQYVVPLVLRKKEQS